MNSTIALKRNLRRFSGVVLLVLMAVAAFPGKADAQTIYNGGATQNSFAYDDHEKTWLTNLNPTIRGQALIAMSTFAIRAQDKAERVAKLIMDEIGNYYLPIQPYRNVDRVNPPTLPELVKTETDAEQSLIGLCQFVLKKIGSEAAAPTIFTYLTDKRASTRAFAVAQLKAFTTPTADVVIPVLPKTQLIKYSSDATDVATRAWLVTQLKNYSDLTKDLDAFKAIYGLLKDKEDTVRAAAADALAAYAPKSSDSLDYLADLAALAASDKSQKVRQAAKGTLDSVIAGVLAAKDKDTIAAAVEKQVVINLKLPLDTIVEKTAKSDLQQDAFALLQTIAKIATIVEPGMMTKVAGPPLMQVFNDPSMQNRADVATTIAGIGREAFGLAYEDLRRALFNCTTAERDAIANAIRAVAPAQ